jgi:hypothetical protein
MTRNERRDAAKDYSLLNMTPRSLSRYRQLTDWRYLGQESGERCLDGRVAFA